jgi:hypothetical protein
MASTTRTRSTRRNPFHPRPRSWPESGTWDTGAWIAKVASVWASAVGNPRHIRVHGLARTRGLPYRPRCDIHDSRSPHRRTDGFSTLWRRGSTAKACTSYSPATSITRSEIPPSSSRPPGELGREVAFPLNRESRHFSRPCLRHVRAPALHPVRLFRAKRAANRQWGAAGEGRQTVAHQRRWIACESLGASPFAR